MQKKRSNFNDDWRAPRGSGLARITTGIMAVILLAGGIIAVWLLFGRDISRAYDSVFTLPGAKERAAAHISEKYGFDAEIVNAEVPDDAETIFMPDNKSDYTLVTMQYDGKQFYAAVSRKDEAAPVCDNYQTDDIEAALSAAIDECEPWKVKMSAEQVTPLVGKYIFYNTYFTGANWQELHDERPLKIYVRYFDVPLTANRFEPLLKLGADLTIETYTEDESGSDKLVSTVTVSDGRIS